MKGDEIEVPDEPLIGQNAATRAKFGASRVAKLELPPGPSPAKDDAIGEDTLDRPIAHLLSLSGANDRLRVPPLEHRQGAAGNDDDTPELEHGVRRHRRAGKVGGGDGHQQYH